ncbi:MAG TPA: thermonuclease family protein [Ilumatobacteraceae bacterium]|nr:thermonuclease family protein [Ilumatobacteraceae bacterium]
MRFAVAAVWVCALGVAGCAGGPEADARGIATVVQVVDGDTIDVEIGGRTERVRLIGIDTPETKRPDTPIECYGPEASAFTTSLLPTGTEVRIERDVVGRDDYGRLLGYVHLIGRTSLDTDVFVNMEIVERGFARPLTIEPNGTFAREFASAARRAERNDLGLWAACSS